MILMDQYILKIIFLVYVQDLMRYTGGGGDSAGSFYHAGRVPGDSPDNSSKQVLLGWRLGVSLTIKPSKTSLFTKECHNVDMLKQQGVADNMAVIPPERKKAGTGIWQDNREDMVVCHESLTVCVTRHNEPEFS